MNTLDRANAVSVALTGIEGIIAPSPAELLAPLAEELGHPEILDRFCDLPPTCIATPLSPLLHIIGEHAPVSGLRSLVRGLILGADNLVAAPPSTLFTQFLANLPAPLRSRVQIENTLPDSWPTAALGIIAFAPESTLSALKKILRPGQLFDPHPPSVSLALILDDPDLESPQNAAKDIATSIALGENFIHNIYISPAVATPTTYAQHLATALDQLPLPSSETLPPAVTDLRSGYTFRAATDTTVSVHGITPLSPYTIIAEQDPLFATSPAPGTVFVKPLPEDLSSALRFISSSIDTIAIHPFAKSTGLSTSAAHLRPLGSANVFLQPIHQHGHSRYSPWVDYMAQD